MEPIICASIGAPVINRAAIPFAAIIYRAVVDRHVPIAIGATVAVAIASRVIAKTDAAVAKPETKTIGTCR
jgi:hypothetical protein